MREGKRERSGRARREGASLYLEKAAGEAMQGALPETGAPTPMGRHLPGSRNGRLFHQDGDY